MTAVSLPDARFTDFSDNMKMVCDTMSIFSWEDQLLRLSKENVDQIRKTMMQHEELFKEQVQALHKLYIVQKSAMQEVRKMIMCSAQPLASSSNNKDAHCDQLNDSIVEGNHSNESYLSAKDHIEEACVLPVNPHSAVGEFTGSSSEKSFCSDIKEVKVFPNASNVQRKMFDLERPPEEYMDESDCRIESNNFDILGSKSLLLERSENIIEESSVRSNQADIQLHYPNLKQRDGRPDFGTRPEPSEESCWDCSEVSDAAGMKCTSGIQRLQDTSNNKHNFSWDCLPAVGLCTANPLVDSKIEKLMRLFQAAPLASGKSNCAQRSDCFESEELSLEKNDPEELKGTLPRNADHTDLNQLYPALESNGKIVLPNLEVEKQLQPDPGECFPTHGGSPPPNPTSRLQSSDQCIQRVSCLLDTKPLERDLNSCSWVLMNQTGDNNKNPNRSGHGSNSSVYECEVKFRDKDHGTVTSNKAKYGSDWEPVETGHVEVEEVKLGLEEASQLGNDDNSSSAIGSDNKQRDAAELKCALNSSETEKDQEESEVVKESKEEIHSDSTLEEACESIAAKILLSFAPSKSQCDSKWQFCETQIEVETSRSGRERMDHNQRQHRCTRRALNYRNGVGIDESVQWTKSICGRRRRSSRRQ